MESLQAGSPAFWFSNGIILHGKLTRHNQHFSKRCICSRKFCFRSSANIVSVQIYVFPKSKTSFPNLIIVILKQFKLFIVLYCDGWISDMKIPLASTEKGKKKYRIVRVSGLVVNSWIFVASFIVTSKSRKTAAMLPVRQYARAYLEKNVSLSQARM